MDYFLKGFFPKTICECILCDEFTGFRLHWIILVQISETNQVCFSFENQFLTKKTRAFQRRVNVPPPPGTLTNTSIQRGSQVWLNM